MVLVLMFICSSQPSSTEKTDIAAADIEKLLPTLLSVVDLKGLLGLAKGNNKDISEDKEVPSLEKAQHKGVNQLKRNQLIVSLI